MPVTIRDRSTVTINRQTSQVTVATAGVPGPSHDTWVFRQDVPSAVWTIEHPFEGQYPSVTIVDSAGTVVHGAIAYTSPRSIEVTFRAAFAGRAFIN